MLKMPSTRLGRDHYIFGIALVKVKYQNKEVEEDTVQLEKL